MDLAETGPDRLLTANELQKEAAKLEVWGTVLYRGQAWLQVLREELKAIT